MEKVNSVVLLFNDLGYEQQYEMFALLGNSTNQEIYETSTMKSSGQDLTLEDLKYVGKNSFYQECDGWLKTFIDHLTARKKSSNENTNYNANKLGWAGPHSRFPLKTAVQFHQTQIILKTTQNQPDQAVPFIII